MRTTYTKEMDVDGEKLTFDFELEVGRDNNYGADADGNRGVTAIWIDDYSFEVLDERMNTIEKDQEIIAIAEKIINDIDITEVL